MPDGREEVDLEEVVVLFTDPEEVEQRRSHLVIEIMVVLIFIMIAISIMIVNSITATFEQEICPQRPDPQWRGQAEV